jgi:hypothetical protein
MSGDRLTPTRMVHVRTVPTPFHASVIAARLGAEGIVTELRGNMGGPYPFGEASVWVAEQDADDATELLLADEVEAAFDRDDDEPARPVPLVLGMTARQILAAAGLVLVLFATLSASAHLGL